MRKLSVLLMMVLWPALGWAQNTPCPSVVSNYTVGNTYCIQATGTSQIAIPNNPHRRYLLIQSESTTDSVYWAEASCTTNSPLTAVIGTNTLQLAPQSGIPTNYEVNGLNQGNSLYLSAGAIAIVTGGTTDYVCFKEMN